MVVFRCTAKLLQKLAQPVTEAPGRSTTALGDWYANTLNLGQTRLVLCCSEHSLLPAIIPLRSAAPLIDRWQSAVGDRLRRLGLHASAIDAELGGMRPVEIAPTASRSVLGSMNDFANHCRWISSDRGVVDVRELEARLDELPCGALRYANPIEVTRRLLGAGATTAAIGTKNLGSTGTDVTLTARSKATIKLNPSAARETTRRYTLEVSLLSGPITAGFARKNPVVSRTVQIRGDQTLEELHYAIFNAFDRWDDHLYEFNFGKGPQDPEAPRYVQAMAFDPGEARVAGGVEETTIASLNLKIGRSFGYWFDFGDDWWHQINVQAIDDTFPAGKLPKVTKRIGKSQPQYPDE